jgi:hypothetical protein
VRVPDLPSTGRSLSFSIDTLARGRDPHADHHPNAVTPEHICTTPHEDER